MNVLSLFDGMSCGQLALHRSNIKIKNYFASEIDRSAIKVTVHNFPNTIQLGDVINYKNWTLPTIDLLLGGTPCQDVSIANKTGKGLDGSKSSLFWFYRHILYEYKPKYFLLENVKMSKKNRDIISEELGVEPVLINSALLSAQKRNRYYWTNIPFNVEITDKNIMVHDILESTVPDELYLTKEEIRTVYVKKASKVLPKGKKEGSIEFPQSLNRKSLCLLASDTHKSKNRTTNFIFDGKGIRRFSPVECERLQTVPDNYTFAASMNQRYKMLGNGWTVDVISHILNGIKN